jgi:bacteriocin biosynthesis cyclodehydratase domain-containing protein
VERSDPAQQRTRTLRGMSRHLPVPRPARPVLRRGRDRVQIGLDPERTVVIEQLSDVASSALLHLDGATGRHEFLARAPELTSVLDELDRRGLLDDDPGPYAALSTTRRERLAPDIAGLSVAAGSTPDALRVIARRARSAVVVRGSDRVAAHVATGLAAAGVGIVVVEGPDRTTTPADLTPVGPLEPHASWREQVHEALRRLGAHPTAVGTRARRPAVTVLCAAADTDLPWTDPALADDLLADEVPHLPVAVTADAARVGPLVLPGRSACLWCLDHRQHERDPAWPALTDQVRLHHATARAQGSVLATAAAATAVAQALQLVDTPGTARPLSVDAILELRSPDAVVTVLPVARHPLCGCGWTGATRTMVG